MSVATAARSSVRIRFDRAEVLVLDAMPANGESLRASLKTIGMHRIKLVTNIADAAECARANDYDLFLADVSQHTDEICALVRSMREGRMSANPFLHIVLLARKLENDVVRQSVNCGADEFVTRPFSVAFLEARFKALMSVRADFVVAGEYIGPDRRRDQTRRKDIEVFTAPNSLKVKCQEDFSAIHAASALRAQIRSTCAMLNARRIQKNALRLPVLVRLLKEAFAEMVPLQPGLDRLHATATDMIDRARNSGARSVLADAEPILDAIAGAQAGVNVAAHIETAGRLAADMYLMLNTNATRDSLKREVECECASFKSHKARA